MDREILLSGIGGQGVQLAAKLLAHAGMLDGRDVMQFSMFSGTMRGGSSECTVVVADAPVEAPPIVPRAWAAIAMHPGQLERICEKLRPGGAVLYNETLMPGAPSRPDCRWFGIDAGRVAAEQENPQGQSLVALGAFAALTGIVRPEALARSLADLLPPYRHATIAANLRCLEAGAEAAGDVEGRFPAWSAET